jgi:hypothetical protein
LSDVPTYLPVIIILAAAALAILVVLYRLYDSRVEQPKKLEDELREGLETFKADVIVLEPVRKAAAASSFAGDRLIIVEDFGKKPHRPYNMSQLLGMEVIVDDKVIGRVMRSGPHIMLDDLAPVVHRVSMRLILDDPAYPSFELVIWDPNDTLTARAEGPRAAMNNVRKWFYHVEAVLRRTISAPQPVVGAPAAAAPVRFPDFVPAPSPAPPPASPPMSAAAAPVLPLPAATPPGKPEGDVLNAPLIPYL